MYRTTIKCYDCGEMVPDLKVHRAVCSSSRHSKAEIKSSHSEKGERPSLLKCYDCQLLVANLREHKSVCLGAGKELSATRPSKAAEGVTIYALLDVSSSMNDGRLDYAKEALVHFFSDMEDTDRLSIVSFDTKAYFKLKPRPVGQLRRNKELPPLLGQIFAKGGTAIYDAIFMTIEQLPSKLIRTALVVLTDGDDNSSVHTMEDVYKLLELHPMVSLNIVHVDGSECRLPAYEHLCSGRGEYVVIKETLMVEVSIKMYMDVYKRLKKDG